MRCTLDLPVAAVAAVLALCGESGTAAADPGFPDLDAFTVVPTAPYEYRAPTTGFTTIEFSTPDGVNCRFNVTRRDETSTQELSCRGRFPDDASAQSNDYCADVGSGSSFVYRIHHQPNECVTSPRGVLLPAGSKISAGDITCAVGAGSLTACLDTRAGQRHGFVLQPSGSTAF